MSYMTRAGLLYCYWYHHVPQCPWCTCDTFVFIGGALHWDWSVRTRGCQRRQRASLMPWIPREPGYCEDRDLSRPTGGATSKQCPWQLGGNVWLTSTWPIHKGPFGSIQRVPVMRVAVVRSRACRGSIVSACHLLPPAVTRRAICHSLRGWIMLSPLLAQPNNRLSESSRAEMFPRRAQTCPAATVQAQRTCCTTAGLPVLQPQKSMPSTSRAAFQQHQPYEMACISTQYLVSGGTERRGLLGQLIDRGVSLMSCTTVVRSRKASDYHSPSFLGPLFAPYAGRRLLWTDFQRPCFEPEPDLGATSCVA